MLLGTILRTSKTQKQIRKCVQQKMAVAKYHQIEKRKGEDSQNQAVCPSIEG